METYAALPQLDEAITYLQADIAALRAGEKDSILPALAVAIAAGEAPLPEPQFTPLLAQWTPAATSIPTELAALVDQFEAVKRREQEKKLHSDERNVKLPVHLALQRVRGQRTRPRTRPRRRFEELDTEDASASASEGTPSASPRQDVIRKEEEGVGHAMEATEQMEEQVDRLVMEHKVREPSTEMLEEVVTGTQIQAMERKEKVEAKVLQGQMREEDANGWQATRKGTDAVNKEQMEASRDARQEETIATQAVGNDRHYVLTTKGCEKVAGNERNDVGQPTKSVRDCDERAIENTLRRMDVPHSEKKEAEAALASLKSLRKSMLLDVLSKIVSVAKSKGVNAATLSLTKSSALTPWTHDAAVDLATIHDRVARGNIREWAPFADHVYRFCQQVVTTAEQCQQAEARRKGVELLHFARTLTETLRKASVKKELALMQQIHGVDAVRTEKKGAGRYVQRMNSENVHKMYDGRKDGTIVADTKDGNPSKEDQVAASRTPGPRLVKRPSRWQGTVARSVSPTRQYRGSVSAASASEDASGSESHDAEADNKALGRCKSSKTVAKRPLSTRRRRCHVIATRTSSRQQKRRAAAAAAAGGDSGDEALSGHEALSLVEDEVEKELEDDTGRDDEHMVTKKKKGVKAKARKKMSRKR